VQAPIIVKEMVDEAAHENAQRHRTDNFLVT
jgi:hypothetical protein